MTTATLIKTKTDNRSLTWYLVCRTAVITLLLGGAAVLFLKGSVRQANIPPLFYLLGISYAEALLAAALLKKIKNKYIFSQLQIIWDLLFVTALILLTGGVESVFSFAYLLVIISASFLLSRRLTVLAAVCSVILFGGIMDLQFFGYLDFFDLGRSVSDGTFFSTLFVHSVAFFLTAMLSGTLSERWRESEAELQQKTVDFVQLEEMNRTILAHINSGLMLIDPQGIIRSFNRAASDITNLSLQDVYGQAAEKFFPELYSRFKVEKSLEREEGAFIRRDGYKLTLGYATTRARGARGENVGTLVTFQDLTQFKKIEEDLKRADRLAAVGRLAAGMAHEIRNPLASISGSVQLLMEAEHVRKEDHKLMKIVVKEAERLNGLLTDFLGFARPKPPEKNLCNISEILNDLASLLKTDKRFENVEILQNYPPDVFLTVDRDQIRQALWDLAVNATEAMRGFGRLAFRIDMANKSIVCVEDSGPGIDEQIANRIFEPFFSTKEKGTGLGLALVYSVLEAHGGRVTTANSDFGGACFRLHFPDERTV